MSNYLIELALIHTILVLGYWFFLKNEHQYHKMRFYLVGSTFLAITIPLLKLPKLFFTQDDPLITEVITLGAASLTPTPVATNWYQLGLLCIYLTISTFLLVRLIKSLAFLLKLKSQSRYQKFNDLDIYKVQHGKGSFTFLHWIFLSEDVQDHQDYEAILKHEKAHAALGHTYDLLFFELFKICFWWLPTAWFINKEIRKIHEYQADAYALKWCHVDQYSSILISSTLNANGLSLASSFHDGLILKRLKAMKQRAKNVSPWKLGALSVLCTLLVIVFACTEEIDSKEPQNRDGEVFTVVEELPQPIGGMDAFYRHIAENMKYPLQARRMGIEGKVFVQFTVEKDGSLSQVQAIKGIGAGCDEEAVRVISEAPAFEPGTQRGMPVRVRMELPVQFKLNQGKTNPDNSTQGMIILDKLSTNNPGQLKVETSYANGIWSGKVFDEQGGGLPGANVVVEGTNTGAVTDLSGYFEVKANRSDDLVVSFVGYQSVKVAGKN